jgi:hypothetical protein
MIDSFDRLRMADAAPRGSEPPGSVLTLEALLVDIDERAGYMPIDTQVPDTATKDTRSTRRGWLTAAVAFAVVLLIGIGAVLMMSQGSVVDPSDEVTVTTEALSAELQVTYDTALEAIAVFNSGDIDAWMKLFRQDGAFWGLQMSGTHTKEFIEFRMALGEQITVDSCVPHLDGMRVECAASYTGGLGSIWTDNWIVRSDEKGRVLDIQQSGRIGDDPGELIAAMGVWIEETYPEVWESVFVAAGDCSLDLNSLNCFNGAWYGTADTALELVRLADEFFAQSDTYPLGG